MKTCEHCRKKLGKFEGEGVMCECGGLFVLCKNCLNDLHGGNCPECGEFCAVFEIEGTKK